MNDWKALIHQDEIAPGQVKVVRTESKQLALISEEKGQLHVIDNRCPHEGYPLSTGHTKEGVLTCAWHNWKFRLCDGACMIGGEDVQRYPAKLEDGTWYAHLSPDLSAKAGKYFENLERAYYKEDWGTAGRTMTRLLQADVSPEKILAHAVDWSAGHEPYGSDHGIAQAADWLDFLGDFGEEVEGPLLQAVSIAVEPSARYPQKELPEAIAAPQKWAKFAAEIHRLVEEEEGEKAQALLRGGLEHFSHYQIFGLFQDLATVHYLSYGHGHIFVEQAKPLLKILSEPQIERLWCSLLEGIVLATREDTLPYMNSFNRFMQESEERFVGWQIAELSKPLDADTSEAFFNVLLKGDIREALVAAGQLLDQGYSLEHLGLILCQAAGARILQFDPEVELSTELREGWLHITHALTHAEAVLQTILGGARRPALMGLFHSVRLISHVHPLCKVSVLDEIPAAPIYQKEALQAAIRQQDSAAALAQAKAALAEKADLRKALVPLLTEDLAILPIFLAHRVKTTAAALRVSQLAGVNPRPELPILGTIRYLSSKIVERRIHRQAGWGRDFVLHAKTPPKPLGY